MKSPTQNVCQVENSVRGKPQWKMAAPDITHKTRNETQKSIKIITRHVDLSGEQTLLVYGWGIATCGSFSNESRQ